MTDKVNGNGSSKQNLDALKAYYDAIAAKRADKNAETKDVKTAPIEFTAAEDVEVSALDATAAQIWGVQLSKVDKSDVATTKRIEQAYANSSFMKSLDALQGIELNDDFVAFAAANVKGVDPDKLQRYMNKPLGDETANGIQNYMNALA